jgi:hypothetical protein
MSIFLVETWVVKPEHEQEHEALWRHFVDYMNQNRILFKGIISMQLYRRLPVTSSATHAQTVEFSSLEDKLALDERVVKDPTCVEFSRNLARVKDSRTISEVTCEPFLQYGP